MPACTTESLTKLWNTDTRENVKVCWENSGSIPSSPNSSSPLSTSPMGTLKRSRSATSTTGLFPEHFTIKSEWRSSQNIAQKSESKSFLIKVIGWYPCFLFQVLRAAIAIFLPTACVRILISLPTMWFSTWFWIFWKVFDFPLSMFKKCLTFLCMPTLELMRKKRTVLISGGSSIQALHLARNFYSAGARVVVCEIEEREIALTRFSTAVSKFYTIPKPTTDNIRSYVKALCDIVEKEDVTYYIPVNITSPAFYDAQAKPMLELLGCICFCPGVKEVCVLDDTLEMLRRCVDNDIPTPAYFSISSMSKLAQLYQNGSLRSNKYVMSNCGPSASKERLKVVLPPNVAELRIPGEISDSKPWVVVEEQSGHQFITCTTVKNSQVVANVTCKFDHNKSLIPVDHKDIENWLRNFFSRLNLMRLVSGHFSFRFVISKNGNKILPMSCKVGISLPYICHTNVHPKIIWKPCKHFNRQSSGPLITEKGRYWMHQAFLDAVQKPSVDSLTRFIGTVLDRKEVLFVFWDPLPYCLYYHMQLPFRNILEYLQRRRFPGTMAAPVH